MELHFYHSLLSIDCNSECNEGQRRCLGYDTGMCCNWYFDGICQVRCPLFYRGNPETFVCGRLKLQIRPQAFPSWGPEDLLVRSSVEYSFYSLVTSYSYVDIVWIHALNFLCLSVEPIDNPVLCYMSLNCGLYNENDKGIEGSFSIQNETASCCTSGYEFFSIAATERCLPCVGTATMYREPGREI